MDKPSSAEDEYFAREQAEQLRKLAHEEQRRLAATEREKLKNLHFMHCPKCGMDLKTISFRGLEIDRCFSCEGTWLDAGELEKLSGKGDGSRVVDAVLNVFRRGPAR